jgi:hypothetical protein
VGLRPELRAVVSGLLQRPDATLNLDDIAEAIGDLLVSTDEIDEIFSAIEAKRSVDAEPPVGARESLARVLASARALKQELGRAPAPSEIEQHSGLSAASVRLALLYARTLQR